MRSQQDEEPAALMPVAPNPFRLDDVIAGLADDLDALRAGRITVEDARARAGLAKQFIASVRLVYQAQRFLANEARAIVSTPSSETVEGEPDL